MDENVSQSALQLKINKLKNLPKLPEASMKILEAINDPDICIDKLASVLSMSPDLTARLLGLANSAYFGQDRSINDVRTAIFQVLGLQLVKSLALGIVLNVQFDTKKCRAFDTEYFWMRSLLTAVIAQKLVTAAKSKNLVASTAYTAGLLLNIGILVMGYLLPEELNTILVRCKKNNLSISNEIARDLGQSYFHLGFSLLQKWHLSILYQNILNYFDDKAYQGEEADLILLLKASQKISGMLLNDDEISLTDIEELAEAISIPVNDLSEMISILSENKHEIQNLAQIMGS